MLAPTGSAGSTDRAPSTLTVEWLRERAGTETVYNLEVNGRHAYTVGAGAVVVHNACPDGVGAGEDLFVGTYKESRRGNAATGLDSTHSPHHAPQDAVSRATHGSGITINLRRDLHEQTRTFRRNGDLGDNTRNLAADVRDLRNILQKAAYERGLVNQQMRALINQNRAIGNVP